MTAEPDSDAQVAALREALEAAGKMVHGLSYVAHARTDWATCQKPECAWYHRVLSDTEATAKAYRDEVERPWREAAQDAIWTFEKAGHASWPVVTKLRALLSNTESAP